MNRLTKDKSKPFSEIWANPALKNMGIEGGANDLYEALVKTGTPPTTIEALISTLSVIDDQVQWCIENLVSSDDFQTWIKNVFLKHTHSALVPSELRIPATTENSGLPQ